MRNHFSYNNKIFLSSARNDVVSDILIEVEEGETGAGSRESFSILTFGACKRAVPSPSLHTH